MTTMPVKLLAALVSLQLLVVQPAYAESLAIFALPEPGSVLLMGLGLAIIGLFHKQGRRVSRTIQRWLRARLQR